MPTVTLREAYDSYISATVEVTDEEYSALLDASRQGDTSFLREEHARLQREAGDLEWELSGQDLEDSRPVAIEDENGDVIWYESDDETPWH